MAAGFNERGVTSAAFTGKTAVDHRDALFREFRAGRLRFLLTRDAFNAGLDVPEINTSHRIPRIQATHPHGLAPGVCDAGGHL